MKQYQLDEIKDLAKEAKEEIVICELKINVLEKKEMLFRLNRAKKNLASVLKILEDKNEN